MRLIVNRFYSKDNSKMHNLSRFYSNNNIIMTLLEQTQKLYRILTQFKHLR